MGDIFKTPALGSRTLAGPEVLVELVQSSWSSWTNNCLVITWGCLYFRQYSHIAYWGGRTIVPLPYLVSGSHSSSRSLFHIMG